MVRLMQVTEEQLTYYTRRLSHKYTVECSSEPSNMITGYTRSRVKGTRMMMNRKTMTMQKHLNKKYCILQGVLDTVFSF